MAMIPQNSPTLRASQIAHSAAMHLALEDYHVLRTTTDGFTGRVSILINRPYAGLEAKITRHAEKQFGSVEYRGCRVYWEEKAGQFLPNESTI